MHLLLATRERVVIKAFLREVAKRRHGSEWQPWMAVRAVAWPNRSERWHLRSKWRKESAVILSFSSAPLLQFFLYSPTLPQSASLTAPSGGSLFTINILHSSFVFLLFIGNSLFRTTRLSRGFRFTNKKATASGCFFRLSYYPDSNRGPRPYQGRALPTEP